MTQQPAAIDGVEPAEAMPCRVFGIVRSDTDLPEWEDEIAARDIGLVRHGDVAALVEPVDPARRPGRADLLTHSAVLNAVAATGNPVVPVQFGSVVATQDAVADDLLAPRSDHWQRMLDELRGRSQFTLRATYEQERILTEVVTENPQIAELREQTTGQPDERSHGARVRLGELVSNAVAEKRARDTEMLELSLAPHADLVRTSPGSGLEYVTDIAFLVDHDQRETFEHTAERLAEQVHERIALRLLGPLAPFDFVPEE